MVGLGQYLEMRDLLTESLSAWGTHSQMASELGINSVRLAGSEVWWLCLGGWILTGYSVQTAHLSGGIYYCQ